MTGQEAALEFFQEQEEVKKHDLRKKNSNDLCKSFKRDEKKLKR